MKLVGALKNVCLIFTQIITHSLSPELKDFVSGFVISSNIATTPAPPKNRSGVCKAASISSEFSLSFKPKTCKHCKRRMPAHLFLGELSAGLRGFHVSPFRNIDFPPTCNPKQATAHHSLTILLTNQFPFCLTVI